MIAENYHIFFAFFYNIQVKRKMAIIMITIDDIPIGTHTGAIHGRGIRKRTSIVVSLDGHLIKR